MVFLSTEMMSQGFTLMGYGLLGVFSALALFYIAIKLLHALFPAKPENKDE